jgi:hypothetical protein
MQLHFIDNQYEESTFSLMLLRVIANLFLLGVDYGIPKDPGS